jgi:RimJ/RimL family protein N-acetyltransferase
MPGRPSVGPGAPARLPHRLPGVHAGGDRPLGGSLDWTPARVPERAGLEGELVRLEPVDPAHHGPALFESSHGEAAAGLWDYLPNGPFATHADFTAWLEACATSEDPLFFTIVDTATGRPEGMCSYLRITPGQGVIEIGHIWFSPALQRTRQATEAIYLLARHVFDDLGYRRLEWKCNALNEPSRRAAERLGFTFEGVFRQHMVVKGRNRDTAWYAMLDGDWPVAGRAFREWLSAGNVDEDGRQRRSLAAVRASIAAGPGH